MPTTYISLLSITSKISSMQNNEWVEYFFDIHINVYYIFARKKSLQRLFMEQFFSINREGKEK